MLSVNSSSVTQQQQNTVAFRGKAPKLGNLSKKILESREHIRKYNQAKPSNNVINLFTNIRESIELWFANLNIKFTSKFIKNKPSKVDYSKLHSFKYHDEMQKFYNNITKPLKWK